MLEKLGQEDVLKQKITDWTAGKAEFAHAGEVYVDALVLSQE